MKHEKLDRIYTITLSLGKKLNCLYIWLNIGGIIQYIQKRTG